VSGTIKLFPFLTNKSPTDFGLFAYYQHIKNATNWMLSSIEGQQFRGMVMMKSSDNVKVPLPESIEKYDIKLHSFRIFLMAVLALIVTWGAGELVFEGIFTDFQIDRNNFTDFQIVISKIIMWAGIIFSGGTGMVMLYVLCFYSQPMIRLDTKGVWLQWPAKKYSLVEWECIEKFQIYTRTVRPLGFRFLQSKFREFSIDFKQRIPFIHNRKSRDFMLWLLSFNYYELQQAVAKYSNGDCTVRFDIDA